MDEWPIPADALELPGESAYGMRIRDLEIRVSILQEQYKQSIEDRSELHKLLERTMEQSTRARYNSLTSLIAVLVAIVVAFAQAIVFHGGFH